MKFINDRQEWWFQSVPADATELAVRGGSYLDFQTQGGMDYLPLPEGKWEMHSDSSTMTGSQAHDIVEPADTECLYKCYEGKRFGHATNIQSYGSLLRSLGMRGKRIINFKRIG